MKIFNHSTPGCETPQILAKRFNCELRQLNDTNVQSHCGIKAACMFGITYGPLSSWGRVLKKFLEQLEINKPGAIEALIIHKQLHIIKNAQVGLVPLVVARLYIDKIKQPSKIGDTDFFYDTFTTGENALKVLRNITVITGTEQCLTLYIRS